MRNAIFDQTENKIEVLITRQKMRNPVFGVDILCLWSKKQEKACESRFFLDEFLFVEYFLAIQDFIAREQEHGAIGYH